MFCGLPEQFGESEDDLYEKVKSEMKRIPNCDADNIAIESCYRRGQRNTDFGPRETVVTFLRVSAKQIVSKGREYLSPNVKVKQDLPYELACMQRALMPIKNVAESLPQYKGKVRVTRGSLIIGNKSYNLSTLHEIPKDIDIAKGAWKSSDEVFAYFSVRTVFSNFRWAPITINGVLFENNEKYITFRKAELAKDEASIVSILECDNPYQIKRLGKKITGHNEEDWLKVIPDVAYHVNKVKFTTHPDMAALLIRTHPKRLCEATEEEPWGCGLHLGHKDILNPAKWKRNPGVMGTVLMRIRDELMAISNPITVPIFGVNNP